MNAPALHPLQSLKSLLRDALRRNDIEPLAESLAGQHLPALGGDQHPAEVVYRALALPPVDPVFVDGVARALAALCHSQAEILGQSPEQASVVSASQQGPVPSPEPTLDSEILLFNILLLATLLPTNRALNLALKEFIALSLQSAALTSGHGRVARQLRKALILQQIDESLEGFWFDLIGETPAPHRLSSDRKADLLDAWEGLLWMPSAEEDRAAGRTPPIDRVERGLLALHKIAGGTADDLLILRYAVRQLDEAYPRSLEFWVERLGPRLSGWPQLLQDVVAERWPRLSDEGAEEFALPAGKAREAWQLLSQEVHNEIGIIVLRRDPTAWKRLWERLFFMGPAEGMPRQKWIAALQAIRFALEERHPQLHSDSPAIMEPDEASDERSADERRKPTRVDRLAAFERVTRAVTAIEGKLEVGDLRLARRFLDELIRDQEASADDPKLIVKTLCNVAASAAAAGELEWAQRLYEDARSRGVEDVVARTGLAEVLKAQDRLIEAETLYRDTVAQFPNNVFARNGLAEVLKAQDRRVEAEILYRETVTQFPNDVVARTGLAEVLKAQDRLIEAETLYRDTVAQFPNNVFARTGLAEVLKTQERFAEAESLYRETAAHFPNNVVVRNGLAEVLKAQEQFAEAEFLYRETTAQFPNDVFARNGLAEVLKAQEHFVEAESLYRDAIAQFPNDRVSRHGLANLLRLRGKLTEALQLVPEPAELRGLQDLYDLHLVGMIFLEQGDVSLAIAAFKRGLEGNPSRRSRQYFHGALALACLRQDRFEDAQRELAAAPEATPEVDALQLHALAGQGRTAEAKEMYSKVSGRILAFRKPTAHAVDKISISWGLRPNLDPRQPTSQEVDEVLAAEIEMLIAA